MEMLTESAFPADDIYQIYDLSKSMLAFAIIFTEWKSDRQNEIIYLVEI